MAVINGVTIEPLSDGSQDINYQVEQFIFWGAGRAAVLAMSPKFSNAALCANATYMITRIAHLYDVELQNSALVSVVGGLSTALATAAISLLLPVKALRIPVAVGLTYAIGKVANIWIQDGMPSDIDRYKPMIAEFFENGKAIAGDIIRDAAASIPFTQCQKDVWAGVVNETGLAKEQLEQVYAEKIAPAVDKWNNETKYQVHDSAAEVVAKVSDAAKEKIDAVKDTADTVKELAKAGAEVAKATSQIAAENAKDSVSKAAGTVIETTKAKIDGFRK